MQTHAPWSRIQMNPVAMPPVPFLLCRPRVVSADEDADAQDRLRTILTEAGCDVVAASNIPAALECVWEHLPDLIILDHTMAHGAGAQLCKRLREHPETDRIPIVLHSEQPPPKESDLYDCVCSKPAERSALLLVIRTLLMLRE